MSTRATAIAAGIAPAVLLVALALWEAWAAVGDARDTPSEADWRAAEGVVRSGFRPGDLIVFAPEWFDPIGRMHLGDLIAIRDAARMDDAKYARIWAVSQHGGRLDVERREQTPVHVLADVRDLLASARVEGGGARRELAEVGFAPHDCIQVEPSPKHPVRITFPAVPLGGKLVGYVGLADVFTRRDIRAPGKLAVEIAGAPVVAVEPGVEDGWVRFEAATKPGPADVTFVVSADAPRRLVCFAAEARE